MVKTILSEKLEDNKAAAEWGKKQAELMKKSEEITRRLTEKYTPIILSRNMSETGECIDEKSALAKTKKTGK